MTEQNELSHQDLTNAVLIFSTALSEILQDKQGIIINGKDERIKLPEPSDFLLVFKMDDTIQIQKYDGDLQPGTVVNLKTNENQD